ncbi:YHYH protein [Leptospira koniambonensis]|uniref:YHYH protein n=1 Tax=Leptospira koniambonensis TaxID=2484950 RepID=UPI003EBCBA07
MLRLRSILLIAVAAFIWNCDSSGGTDLSSAAVLLSASQCTPTTSTTMPTTLTSPASCSAAIYNATDDRGLGGPTCVTSIAAEAPCWIKDNFHCVTVTVEGSNYVITTTDRPPHSSSYYTGAGDGAYYDSSMDSGFHTNPNHIIAQNITMTIPVTPTVTDCSQSNAGTDSVGITTLGVVIFNNQAAPGDSFATEYYTMDPAQGHPQNTGKYHYHTEPYKITNNDDSFVGVMLDGFPIYGKKNQSGSYPTLDSNTHTTSCTPTEFPDGTYCYHVENNTGLNGYIIGSYFKGTPGSVD